MKLIIRLYVTLLWVVYFLTVITSPLWQFISLVIFGTHYSVALKHFFDYVYDFEKKYNVYNRQDYDV